MRIAIFGAGLSGRKRGLQCGSCSISGVFDPDVARAGSLAVALKTRVFNSEAELLASEADIAIIATTNNHLQPLALQALRNGKHVLVEKPAAINLQQIDELEEEARNSGRIVKVGFNHRFHPAIRKMRELIDEEAAGELMFLRARYGHGGRRHMEHEWRFQPEISGGGELLDQGVHILDLIYWFLGPLPLHSSMVTTSYWNTTVDDNAVLTLSDGTRWASFHVSCCEWKNTFSLEVYGRTGKFHVNGLGGSYGKESLAFYRMLPGMGPPEVELFEFDEPDQSWEQDLANLAGHINGQMPLSGDLRSARYAMEQVRGAYRANGFKELPCSA